MVGTAILGLLVSGCSQKSIHLEPSSSSMQKTLSNFPDTGVALPYTVLRDDINDIKTHVTFSIRNGGYGSAMTAHPTNERQFYALTDRGPNATYKGSFGKGKKFPSPYYTPKIGLFELQENGSIKQLKTIDLRRPDGTRITGLPNTSDLGGTGETPYNIFGLPITVDSTKPFDKNTNPLYLDNYGLDSEGLVAVSDGTFWVSDEYGPHIVHFDSTGKEIGRINAFKKDTRVSHHLPVEFANRRVNRGMEGLAITPDEKKLVGIMQSTMYNPTNAVKNLDMTRIVTIDLKSGDIEQFLYKQDKAQNSNSEIVALSNDEYLVIERDGSFLLGGPKKANQNAQKKVYRISLSSGTNLETVKTNNDIKQSDELGLTINDMSLEEVVLRFGWDGLSHNGIKAVQKTEIVDMVKSASYPHDKMEGLWLIDQQHLGVLNDDDFATWATKGDLHQKVLGNRKVDHNRLYIVNTDLTPKK
ncbi:MAG: esterase-like activity of phytase family protein [Gammaproteobacteria bacterium]|nr:esterase-like activity of phytase family protein [Gammaproteobacteria bacterium]